MATVACAQHESERVSGTAVYQRRQPEHSVVYQVLQGHLETWLAGCREVDEASSAVAPHIKQDFRKFLECGILPTGLPGRGVPVVVTISSLPIPVKE